MLADPGWTFGTDPVGALGVSSVNDAQMFFIIACVAGGLFAVLYGIGAGMMHNGSARSVSGFFIVLVGLTLVLAGIAYCMGVEVLECTECSLLALGALAVLCIIISDWLNKRMATASLYLFVLVVGVISIFYVSYEYASAVCIAAFFMIIGIEGVRLLRSK
jgi:hypothetical protein